MSGWTRTAGNGDAGECRSCDKHVWMGTVVVISAVDERISKKKPTYLIADRRGWLVNADPGKRGSYGERRWMRSVLVISAVD